jgi:hypothetical protein
MVPQMDHHPRMGYPELKLCMAKKSEPPKKEQKVFYLKTYALPCSSKYIL